MDFYGLNYFENKMTEKVGPISETHGNCGTAEEWVAWNKKCKEQCPVLYRLNRAIEDIELFFSVRYQKYIIDAWYHVKHRFFLRSHVIKPKTLKKGCWIETDEKILHCLMHELVEYIEKQRDGKPWEVTELEKKSRGEKNSIDGEEGDEENRLPATQWMPMVAAWNIYLWWKNYDNRLKEIDDIYNEIPHDKSENGEIMSGFTQESMKLKKPYYDRIHEKEDALEKEEEEMLIKIIEIRKSLWT